MTVSISSAADELTAVRLELGCTVAVNVDIRSDELDATLGWIMVREELLLTELTGWSIIVVVDVGEELDSTALDDGSTYFVVVA